MNIYRLSSTRQIVYDNRSEKLTEAVVYGGLTYDMLMTDLVKDSKLYSNSYRSGMQKKIHIDSLDIRAGWDFLPGTLVEAENINEILKKSFVSTSLYTGKTGTESSFKNLSGKRDGIIHIATHGFYYSNQDTVRIQKLGVGLISLNENRVAQNQEDASLMRSGLLFAGCNNIIKGETLPDGVDDGILLAKEIVNLDLRGLELVTLSACETALGEVKGEGVYGLQRSFKKAGAKTILMSIDKVDDEATKILMVEFYKNLMKGKTKHQSLKDAQKYLRQVDNGKFDKPEYWASFIMLDGLN